MLQNMWMRPSAMIESHWMLFYYFQAKALHGGGKARTSRSDPQTPEGSQGLAVRTADGQRAPGNSGTKIRGPQNEDQGQIDESKVRSCYKDQWLISWS